MAKFKVGDKAIIKESGEKVRVMGQKSGGLYTVSHLDGRMYGDFSEAALVAANSSPRSTNPVVQNALKACNSGWTMISRTGGQWYYAWADGSQNGTEGPFKSEDEATIAAKQDGFKIKNSAVASNAGDKKCKVTLETVTFNQGVKPETRHMSIPELRTLLKMLGKGSDVEAFIQRLETGGATDIAINDVDLYATLI